MIVKTSADRDRIDAAAAAAGDGAAFRALVERWQGPVRAFCRRMAPRDPSRADDYAQEVLLHLYRVLRAYDPERPFAPWMRRVMAHCVLNRLRTLRPAPRPLEDAVTGEPPADPRSPDPAAEAGAAEEAARLRECLADLPDGWRAVIALRYGEGLPVAAVAEALALPENTVKTRLFRAREALRRRLDPSAPAPRDGARR
jgi:RNA polymerase sigma factor (sigma-70 family)